MHTVTAVARLRVKWSLRAPNEEFDYFVFCLKEPCALYPGTFNDAMMAEPSLSKEEFLQQTLRADSERPARMMMFRPKLMTWEFKAPSMSK